MARGSSPATALAATLALAGIVAAVLLWPKAPAPVALPIAPDAAPAPLTSAVPAADAAATPAEREAVIASVVGKVERLRGVDWASVKVGDRVRAEDSLRTFAAARADLDIGDSSRLTVSEDTQVKVAELTAAVHRFKLRRGRVAAAYQADGARVLRIEGEDGTAVAEARAAAFSVRATDSTFAVATETGTVNLRAAGAQVPVAAGQVSVAQAAHVPSPAAPIPAAMLLKVAASALAKSDPCAVIEGEASPGAEVRVDDQPAAVDAQGHFRAEVEPRGRREIHVVMRDLLGQTRDETIACAQAPGPARDGGTQRIEKLNIHWE